MFIEDEKDEASQGNGSASRVTDADLDAAAEAEESEAEEKEEEEKEEKPDLDNWEKTKMGRKIAAQGGDISELKAMLGQVLSKLENSKDDDPESISNLPLETPTTKQDVIDIMDDRDKRTVDTQKTYQVDFISSANAMRDNPDHAELHSAVMDEMEKNDGYRRKLSGDGKSDGKINYLEAKIAVVSRMSKASSEKTNPLDKNKGEVTKNLGAGSDSKVKPKEGKAVKLDSFAAEFVKDRNMSDESVNRALSKDLPASLAGAGK